MGTLTCALNESFNINDGADIIKSVEKTNREPINESKSTSKSLISESIWDKIAPALGLDSDPKGIEESLKINESNENLGQILDKFYELCMTKDLGPQRAKEQILSEMGIQESLTESKKSEKSEKELTRKERLKKNKQESMDKIVEEFRTRAKFGVNEELTEDKLKYEGWRITNLALKHGVPSAEIREALLKGNK